MSDRRTLGQRVVTSTTSTSTDWDKRALILRRAGAVGHVVNTSDSHGLIYEVEHEDKTTAWYEPEELRSASIEVLPDARTFVLRPTEKVLDDNVPVYPLYVFICDGVFARYEHAMPTTIGDWKRRDGIGEIRRCDLFDHPEARLGDCVDRVRAGG